ncbi:MAG: hypothetical protein JWP60_291 [Ramlibacter sp.]|nr:hypothetical protein [Ramlibacter sp.]
MSLTRRKEISLRLVNLDPGSGPCRAYVEDYGHIPCD